MLFTPVLDISRELWREFGNALPTPSRWPFPRRLGHGLIFCERSVVGHEEHYAAREWYVPTDADYRGDALADGASFAPRFLHRMLYPALFDGGRHLLQVQLADDFISVRFAE